MKRSPCIIPTVLDLHSILIWLVIKVVEGLNINWSFQKDPIHCGFCFDQSCWVQFLAWTQLHLSVYPSNHMSIHLSVCLSVCLPVCLKHFAHSITFEKSNAHSPKLRKICIMEGRRRLLKIVNIDLDLQGHLVLLLISTPCYIILYAHNFEQINAVLPTSQK